METKIRPLQTNSSSFITFLVSHQLFSPPRFLFLSASAHPRAPSRLGPEPVSLHDLLADIQAESFPQLLGAPENQRLPGHRPSYRHFPQPESAGQQKPHVLHGTTSLCNPTSLTRVPPACTARRSFTVSRADPAHLYCLRLVPASLYALQEYPSSLRACFSTLSEVESRKAISYTAEKTIEIPIKTTV